VGVVNAPGIGVAGTVELSVTRFGVELISACFSDLLHPATSRGKATTNAILRPELGSDYGKSGAKARLDCWQAPSHAQAFRTEVYTVAEEGAISPSHEETACVRGHKDLSPRSCLRHEKHF
jgi:hypothetical protein